MNKIILIFTLLIVTYTTASAQCMMTPVLLNQRVSNSSLVIEGKVINQASFWDPSHSNIYTSNLIEVYKAFKSNSSAYVEVITEGGTVGNDKEVVEPSLDLSIGDVGVFTLNANALPSQFNKLVYESHASAQGFIKYNVAENQANEPFKKYLNISTALYSEIQQSTLTNYTVVKPINPFTLTTINSTQAVAAITGFSPTTITAGTFSVLTINGSGFGATQGTSFVEFKRADDGGATFCQPDAWSYISWSDSQIQVKLTTAGASTINSTPGSGVIRVDVGGVKTTSTASLTVQYAHMNVYSSATAPITIYNTRHVAKQSGGYAWQMYTGFDSNTLAKASFLRAFQSWRCGTFINWTTAATSTVNAIAADGINIIRFDVGTELPVGVLGRCSSRFGGCGTQPNQNWYVTELDIVFDDGASWNFGPAAPAFAQYDFESVAVHELGHGHQLGHIINTAEIMNYSLTNGQQKRTLSINDLAGGNAIMARNLSGGVCTNATMTGLTASNCALGAPTASFTANKTTICAGQTVVFTNLSTGSPTLNTWTFAGGTPSTSTVSNPTVTYNTPGTYSVQLVATNSNGSNTYSVNAYINVTSAANLPVVQDFQGSFLPTNWYTEDSGNDNVKWAKSLSAGALTTTNSAFFDNFTTDVTGTRDELKTYVNLSGFTSAKMTFYRAYGLTFSTPNIDSLEIRVSTNCGTSSSQVYYKGGSQISTGNGNGTTIFIPTAAQWAKDSIDLTPYIGQSNVSVSFINRANFGDALYIDQINITGVAAISPTAAINAPSVGCTGTPIVLTDASTGSPTSWTWNTGGGNPTTASNQNVSVTYTTGGVKTITLTVANASGTTTATKSITVTTSPTVAASVTNTTICNGGSVIQNLTGATTYTWLPTGSGTTSTLNPTVITIYTVTGSNGSCVSSPTTFTINVNATPTVNIAASSTTICAGQAATLTASGATNYAWLPGSQTTTAIVVTPSITTTYTVNGANGTCYGTKTITINVSNTPTVIASITNTTICSGTSVLVSVTGGASSYSWTPVGSGTTSALNPTVTTIYTVTGSNGSCVSSPTTFTINVNTTPTVNIAASSTTICAGQTATLTASGATNYAWLPGNQTTSAIVVTPSVTTTYTVNGANGTCYGTKTITINVANTPTVIASITNTTICSGTSVLVSVTGGASSYSWTPAGSGTTSTLNPTVTTIYTVTGSNGSCVSAPTTFTINVNTTPTVNIAASSTTICAGQTATLTASGATNYAWLPGSQTTTAIVVTPSITTTYTLNGANGTCYGTKTITINVANTPTVIASITNTTICSGTSVLVSVTGGASSYSWTPAGSGTTSTLNPTVTTIYTVTGSNGSCVSSPKTFTINVNTTPTVSIAASSATICAGQTSTLTASGATNYAWLPGGQTTTPIVVTPTVTTTYTVNGSNGTCYGTKTITINVSNTPTVVTSITNTTICSGTAVVVSVTGGASSYSWSPAGSGTTSTLNPTVTTIYTVTGSNGSCVSAPKTFTINVNTTPTVNIAASSTTICAGQTSTLTASGATNYAWLPGGQTTTPIVVTPTVTTTYTVNGSNGTCSASKTITINVSNTPTVVTSITNTTICSGTAVVVSVTGGASSYSWSPTGSGTISTLNPTLTTVYTVTGSNGSCVSLPKTFTINVNTTPTVIATATNVSCNGVCDGILNATSSGGSGFTYLVTGGAFCTSVPCPNSCAGTYTVSVTNSANCSSTTTIQITQPAAVSVNVSSTNATCFGLCNGTTTLSAIGGIAPYSYSLAIGSNPICQTTSCAGLCAGVYTVIAKDANNCLFISNLLINEPSQLVATISNTNASCSSCTDGAASSIVSGGTPIYTYLWQPIIGNTPSMSNLPVGCYTCTVTDANGCSVIATTCISFGTKLDEAQVSNFISIYPNPSNGVFTISTTTDNLEITIINTLGQTVKTETIKNASQTIIDMSKMSKGVYYLQAKISDSTRVFKLILE